MCEADGAVISETSHFEDPESFLAVVNDSAVSLPLCIADVGGQSAFAEIEPSCGRMHGAVKVQSASIALAMVLPSSTPH